VIPSMVLSLYLDTVYKISQDPDVISIHGTASLGSY